MKSITVEITTEEKTIVSHLSKGESNKEVAKHLGMNIGSFAGQLKEIRAKYGCLNTTHLVAYFLREGIIN